jgi:hypothetical protein
VVGAGDSLAASGHGCPPGAPVEFRSDGQVIGHATADADGAFQAPLEFTTFAAGRHKVVADCGVELTGAVEQVISSSTGGSANGAMLALLVFFVLAGVGLVRMRAGR